jgi:hypothetical protein
MEFGKKFALQRKVMKLRAREGISLKQAWKRVLAGKKAKKGRRSGPCRSPLRIRDHKTGLCRPKKNLGPSLEQLQLLAVNSGVPITKKLASGQYGRSPVRRAILKARLTRAGVNYAMPPEPVLQPLLAPQAPDQAFRDYMAGGHLAMDFGLKKCKGNQYRSPSRRCRSKLSRPCLHADMVRDRKTLLCRPKQGSTINLLGLQGIAVNNNISITKKLKSGIYGNSPASKRTLKSRLTRAGIAY